jgi:hypothetical protein
VAVIAGEGFQIQDRKRVEATMANRTVGSSVGCEDDNGVSKDVGFSVSAGSNGTGDD